jgi:DNA (cytosine-5)-methyltransferase 1
MITHPVLRAARRPDLNLPSGRGPDIRLSRLLQGDDALARWRAQIEDPNALIALDLFCGAGGMSAGFATAGFVVAAGIDSDPRAIETFGANHLSKAVCQDLSRITSPEQAGTFIDRMGIPRPHVIVAGPPCQGFSIVGRARIRSLPSEEQRRTILARNELYQNFFHFVAALRPLLFVLENVQAIKSWEGGLYFDYIVDSAHALGYDTFEDVLDAAQFGVPQYRRRQFIVGSRIGRLFRFPSPHHRPQVTLTEAIADLPAVTAPSLIETLPYVPRRTGEYQELMRSNVLAEEAGLVHDHVVRPIREDDRIAFLKLRPGGRYTDLDPDDQRYSADTFKDKYYKLKPDEPCITITAHMAKDGYRYIHWENEQCRTLSVREAARIQSFDDAYRFAGHRSSRYRQIGNAVPPLLAHEIAVRVRRAILGGLDVVDDRVWQLNLPLPERLPASLDPEVDGPALAR